MATFIVSYDLNSPGKDYSKLYDALKAAGTLSWHCLDSTWVVVSTLTAAQIRDKLKISIDSNDTLLVVQSANIGAWTGFDTKCSEWLKTNL